jgi:hypothetical protein
MYNYTTLAFRKAKGPGFDLVNLSPSSDTVNEEVEL